MDLEKHPFVHEGHVTRVSRVRVKGDGCRPQKDLYESGTTPVTFVPHTSRRERLLMAPYSEGSVPTMPGLPAPK